MSEKIDAVKKTAVKWDQRSLKSLDPGPVVWTFTDPTTPGLNLRVTPSGTKTFYFTYRLGGRASKKQWLKVGDFDALPLARARELVRAYRVQVDHGVDPSRALKEAAVAGSTVSDAARKFMEDYAPGRLRPNSITGYQGSINAHIIPGLGKIPIKDLTRDRVASWHGSRHIEPIGANRALAVLSSICTQAELWGWRKVQEHGPNPCKHVHRFPETPRIRDITREELQAIGQALEYFRDHSSPWALAAIQVVGLCAGRVSEVLALRRDRDVHLEKGFAIIRDHKASRKAGAKHLELPPAAVAVLMALPELKGNPWYFPGRKEGEPITRDGLHKLWVRVCEKAQVQDLHIHDFRSYVASEGLAQGIAPKITSQLLGHGDARTTEKHYQKVRDKHAAEASAMISAPVAQAFGLEPKPVLSARTLIRRAIQRLKDR